MRYFPSLLLLGMFLLASTASRAQTPTYGKGRAPTDEEIKAWDIDVDMNGKGLPPGKGTAAEGSKIFAQKCAVCHGPTGEGAIAKRLLGGKGSLSTDKPMKTIGSFWPYAPTLFDFINRAMPASQPGTLSANEVYALTAFLLYRNEIIGENDVVDATTLPKVQMPNRNGFIPEVPEWKPGMRRRLGYYPSH
jgi:S-disulfanyl-L-cysteine oxidoreductase SoxD